MTWTLTKSTELDDGVVRWDELGDGPPIVLVHGATSERLHRVRPEIDFTYSFALPGRYKVWVQTERDYAILTASTEVEVRQS